MAPRRKIGRRLARNARRVIGSVPVLRSVLEARGRDRTEALREFLILTLFSLSPFWLGAMVALVRAEPTPDGFWLHVGAYLSLLARAMREGELFIYAVVTLSSVIYITQGDEAASKPQISIYSIRISTILLILVSAALYGAVLSLANKQKDIVWVLSATAYVVALAIFYAALVYKNFKASGAPEVAQEAQEHFVEEFQREMAR